MTDLKITRNALSSALAYAGLDDEDIYADYIGRGSDTPCVGVIVHSPQPLLTFEVACALAEGTEIDPDGVDEDVDVIREYMTLLNGCERSDGMGRNMIQYWSKLHIVEESEAADGE